MKTCTRCGARKRSSGFYTNTRTRDGLRSECKDCSKDMTRLNRERKKRALLDESQKNGRLGRNISDMVEICKSLVQKVREIEREVRTLHV